MENNFEPNSETKKLFSKRNILLFLVAFGVASLAVIIYAAFFSWSKPAGEVEKTPVTALPKEEIQLESVEMKNLAGEVLEITGDKIKIRTGEKEETVLNVSAGTPVYTFSEKGADAKNISDINVGSEISAQTDEKGGTVSVYIIK